MTKINSTGTQQNHFQNDFWNMLVRQVVSELHDHYQDRLVSVYIKGSVHRWEAITPPITGSDLDVVVFIADDFNSEDKLWRAQVNDALHEKIPELPWSTIPLAYPTLKIEPLSQTEQEDTLIEQALRAEQSSAEGNEEMRAAAFRRAVYYQLQYDATLVFGRDLVSGIQASAPTPSWARSQFQQPWDLVRHTADLQPSCYNKNTEANSAEWPLPQTPLLKLRKLARLGVLGAACLTMADNRFESYRGLYVLPLMKTLHPDWQDFLEQTELFYAKVPAGYEGSAAIYLADLVKWMDMIGTRLAV